MAANAPPPVKKYYTAAQANATLPLVRAIVQDITALARELRDRHERVRHLRPGGPGGLSPDHEEELLRIQADLERGQGRMQEYECELRDLGIELKDYFTGLVDFPSRMHGREVYLCWRLGEPDVAYWHELEAGFAGRQKLRADASPV